MTEWHATEEMLVLQYYGELAGEEREMTESHLRTCAACAEARRLLAAALDRVDAAEIPEPDAGFETRMWARVQAALPPRRPAWHERTLVMMGAIAAIVVIGVVTGYLIQIRLSAPPPSSADAGRQAEADVDTREAVLLTALNDHFSQAEILLVELMNGQEREAAAWSFERTAADDLVASGRLYRQTARQSGELQLANMLEDLEGVLVEVARSPDSVDRQDVDFLRARIEEDALLFKVRAVASDIRGRQRRLYETR